MHDASTAGAARDVMQICRNGHVITDLLHAYPERGLLHCERCGASTLDRCSTCGQEIPGAICVPGLVPAGTARPPNYCATCGAAFPWINRPRPPASQQRAQLEAMLRRLPRVIRELRWRQGEQPPFRVEAARDLEDLLRALLLLYFDDIRHESRTPSYDPGTRTDFVLLPQRLAITAKLVPLGVKESQIVEQIQIDSAYYQALQNCATLIIFIYDPEALLREAPALERAWSRREDDFEVRCIIAAP